MGFLHPALAGLALIVAPTCAMAHQAAPAAGHVASHPQAAPRPTAAPARSTPPPRSTPPRISAAVTPRHSLATGATGQPRAAVAVAPGYTARNVAIGSTPTRANTSAYAAPAAMPGWNSGWHSDRRYDWAGWRANHRAVFHLGYYTPPIGGYAYAPIGVGGLVDAAFLSEDFWIDDPSIYHLPPVGDPYHWVRYYNDALLVDLDTGQVVEVIPDIFW
jgi:hypothetical protein